MEAQSGSFVDPQYFEAEGAENHSAGYEETWELNPKVLLKNETMSINADGFVRNNTVNN